MKKSEANSMDHSVWKTLFRFSKCFFQSNSFLCSKAPYSFTLLVARYVFALGPTQQRNSSTCITLGVKTYLALSGVGKFVNHLLLTVEKTVTTQYFNISPKANEACAKCSRI